MSSDDERRFVQRLLARDERAFNELVRAHEQQVFRIVLRMLGRRDEAEDVTQEVFVQVFKAIGLFRGESKISTWVCRIAVNLSKNRSQYLARRRTKNEGDFAGLLEHTSAGQGLQASASLEPPDRVVAGYEAERIVHAALVELEPDFREVLILRDIEDLSYEEIADITGVAEGTVKSRLHRARAMLKKSVEEKMADKAT